MTTLAVRTLNPELQAIAKEELFEQPEKIQENLQAFRDWISKSPHLNSRSDDQFLVAFLRGCKFSLEKAKQKLDLFYTLRTHMPEMMQGRDPQEPKTAEIMKLGFALPLPDTETPGSPRLMLLRPGAYDAQKYAVLEVSKISAMISDILMLEDDNSIVGGQVAIVDLAHVTFAHFIQMQPSVIKKMTMVMQDGMPVRQKGIHYINAPNGFEQLFSLIKSFLNEKMKSRLYVHATLDSLYKVVPRKLLPSEYGGDSGSITSLTETWEKKLLSYRDYFLEDSHYGVDEKKRVGRPKNPETLFGIDGTFRQLQID